MDRSTYFGVYPFMPVARPAFLVTGVTLMSIPGLFQSGGCHDGDMFLRGSRRDLRLRNMFVGLTGILGTMVAGRLLDRVSFPRNFTLLFLIAAGFGGCVSGYVKMREPLLETRLYSTENAARISNQEPPG